MSLSVSIIGASGYTGGELLRLLTPHPEVEVVHVTSERFAGKPVTRCHPQLRGHTSLKFVSMNDVEPCDLVFSCLPHGSLMKRFAEIQQLAPKIIDLSADFRLRNAADYDVWYGEPHDCADQLSQFIYGVPEIYREQMASASYIAGTGCNAVTTILALRPLMQAGMIDTDRPIIAEAKVGSSEAGNKASEGSHHPERSGAMRSYKPVRHRHTAEMLQELSFNNVSPEIHFSATAVEMVRGILVTAHVFLNEGITEKDVWKAYRAAYNDEPFVRIVKDRQGIHRYPDPKILAGTNYCDIGFEKDEHSNRLVIMSALDNLMKGAAGQAVHSMNVMCGFEETLGLEFMGLHPC